ncbi:hypothetical protein CSKR_108865 [Clonorchis sinensis]|uniref:Uncharacterized protein n=1 Tax=Clonorchis sinensis TaxID=79923 RepID=A0A3R7CBI6_CLOSI|nr:hypothetical protein CSKR_108865 [Clonorchis sinensis]
MTATRKPEHQLCRKLSNFVGSTETQRWLNSNQKFSRLAEETRWNEADIGSRGVLVCLGILWSYITGQVKWVTANQVVQTGHSRSSKLEKRRGYEINERPVFFICGLWRCQKQSSTEASPTPTAINRRHRHFLIL